jgi:hypothetical protein
VLNRRRYRAPVVGLLFATVLHTTIVHAQAEQRLEAVEQMGDREPHQAATHLLSPGRAGVFELGATVDEIYRLVGREHVRLVDLFGEGHFTPAIEIRLPGANVTPSIVAHIREAPCREFAIWGIRVLDPRFRTSEGLGIGSTVGELRRTYDARLNREAGHSVIVPSLQMTFAVGGVSFADSVRVTSVWLWPDPSEVRRRRCPGM